MPAPKKTVPPADFDSALIDDGWSLSPEFELPKPGKRSSSTSDRSVSAAPASRTPAPRKKLEDWFDEVDLGWFLPSETAGPPAPDEVSAASEDVDAAYEEIELTTEDEPLEVALEPAEPVGGAHEPGKIDLNTATPEELETLPGVGHKKASAIIAWREENGSFAELADLTGVPGFGVKTVAKLSAHLTVGATSARS